MSAATDKYTMFDNSIDVTALKMGCYIPIEAIYFCGKRNLFRGLEEHIVRIKEEKDHDYVNKTYVYKMETKNGKDPIYIRFEMGNCVIGSDIMF